jgi:hypothetical protein
MLFISTEIWSNKNPEGIVARKLADGFIKNNVLVDVITIKDADFPCNGIKYIIQGNTNELSQKLGKRLIGIERRDIVKAILNRISNKNINLKNYDVIFTRSEPFYLHNVGKYAKTISKDICWIASFGDPVYLNPYNTNNLLKKIIIKRMEMDIWTKADVVTHTNKSAIDEYKKLGFTDGNAVVLTNPYQEDESIEVPPPLDNKKIKSTEDAINYAYIGSLYGKRTPEPLFKYLEKCRHKYKLYLIGAVRNSYYESRFGVLNKFLFNRDIHKITDYIRKYKLEANVEILPFMSQSELNNFIQNKVDVLVNIDANINGKNIFLSSKIVEYLRYNLPILNVSIPGASVDLLSDVGVNDYIDIRRNTYSELNEIPLTSLIPKGEKIVNFSNVEVCKNLLRTINDLYRRTDVQKK